MTDFYQYNNLTEIIFFNASYLAFVFQSYSLCILKVLLSWLAAYRCLDVLYPLIYKVVETCLFNF